MTAEISLYRAVMEVQLVNAGREAAGTVVCVCVCVYESDMCFMMGMNKQAKYS